MKKGFTIVELIIYMALLTAFLMVLLDIFVTTLNMRLSGEGASAINQDSRYILSKMSYDIYNADSLTIPASLGQETTSLEIVRSGITNTYQIDVDGNLVLTVSGVSAKLNSDNTIVSEISFRRIGTAGDKPTVQISYTLESVIETSDEAKSQTINTTLGLR